MVTPGSPQLRAGLWGGFQAYNAVTPGSVSVCDCWRHLGPPIRAGSEVLSWTCASPGHAVTVPRSALHGHGVCSLCSAPQTQPCWSSHQAGGRGAARSAEGTSMVTALWQKSLHSRVWEPTSASPPNTCLTPTPAGPALTCLS